MEIEIVVILVIIIFILIILLLKSNNERYQNEKHPLYDYLYVYDYPNKIRLGNNGDGGYAIANLNNPNYDCYLSCGVANEESFSRDFINKYNIFIFFI